MPDDEAEEFLSFGSQRAALLLRQWWRRPAVRIVAVAFLAAAVGLSGWLALRPAAHRPSLALSRSTHPVASGAPPAAGVTDAADEYLIEVPATDMAAALAERGCRHRCTATNVTGAALVRAAAAFPDLRPLAGGRVSSASGIVVELSVEGLAAPDALVHLEWDRVGAATAGRSVTDHSHDGARTVLITRTRDGWRLVATLVVRGTEPPLAAAQAWCATTAVPPA